ncbi:MAG: outer membrane beta-barrel protein, partial [Flavobacteriales bacterium]
HLFAGPYYASLNKSSSKVFYNGFAGASTIPLQDERDVSDNMNKHDYGVNLGFHYQYKPILVDFRMSYGFTSIFNKEYKPIDYPVRNVYAQLSVAFQFRYKNELDPK